MEKGYSPNNVELLECISRKYNRYIVRCNVEDWKDKEGNVIGKQFNKQLFNHKPSLQEIKDVVLGCYNNIIDEKIISGFVWKDMMVWLSNENQFNYKAAFDLAVQTNGNNLPIVFKFGTTENPVYFKFEDLNTLTEFYSSAMQYINKQLSDGWAAKDALDWSVYEKLLSK